MKCHDIPENLFDYLEGNLDETKKFIIGQHLIECSSCSKELQEIQQVQAALEAESDSIQIPVNFMNNVREKVSKSRDSKRKTNKYQTAIALVASLFLTVFVGTAIATNSFANIADWWRDLSSKQDEQMKDYVQYGLGENLNLTSESNGVKVTITSVVADDIQTLIYYEITDQKNNNKFMINYSDGLKIANLEQNWKNEDGISYNPVTNHLALYSEGDRVYKGRLGVAPMTDDVGTIQLELNKLEKLTTTPGDTDEVSLSNKNKEFVSGNWRFEIPVKKHPSIVHTIDVETEIDGNPVIFDKLTIAPTITVLSYRYQNDHPDKRLEYFKIDSLESKGTFVYDQLGLGGYSGSSGSAEGWNSAEATFESLYFEKPTDVRIHMGSATYSVEDHAQFAIDPSKTLPQSFEYLGNRITIEQLEVGNPTKIVMREELPSNRTYEMLDYYFYDKAGHGSSGASVDGYYIDKDGKKYKYSEGFYRLNELKNPRFFSTEHKIELSQNDNEPFIPVRIEIEGYSVTNFDNQVVKISLD